MLETVRQNSRSAVIYIFFGIIIVAFIVSFGPGSFSGSDSSFDFGARYAAKVYGNEITEQDFRFAQVALGINRMPDDPTQARRIRELVLDRLIERELFAREAEQMGLIISEDEAAKIVAEQGRMYIAGTLRPIDPYAFKAGVFDYERFRQVVQNSYRITVKQFMEIQRRELLADKLRQLMRLASKAAPDEVKADFEDKNRQVNLDYVRFAPYRYEQQLSPSDADIENWARANEEKIKKTYEERKDLYTKQERNVHVRRILIELKDTASETLVNEAKAKLDSAQKTIQSGTRFADVARTVSEDAGSKARGGDLGWRKKTFTDFGEEAEAKVFAAKDGEMIGPERTKRGLELIKIEGFREGDISLGQARTEIAEELFRQDKSKEMAFNAAREAVEKLKAGGKLAELYPKADTDDAERERGSRIQVEETGLFARKGDMVQGVGSNDALARAVFKLKAGEWLGPTEVGGSFMVLTLKDRKEPDLAEFEKKKDELSGEYARTKWARAMTEWGKSACNDAKNAGKIKVNQSLMSVEGPATGPLAKALAQLKYEPCRDRPF